MDKTLESSRKAGLNTKLPICDAERVFRDDEGTYKNRKLVSRKRRQIEVCGGDGRDRLDMRFHRVCKFC